MKVQKPVVFGAALLGTFVLVVAVVAFKRPIMEQWYLWKLDSEDESDRQLAAQNLGALGSVKAIPRLMELFREEYTRPNYRDKSSSIRLRELGPLHYSAQALITIGPPAVPALVEAGDDLTRLLSPEPHPGPLGRAFPNLRVLAFTNPLLVDFEGDGTVWDRLD